MTAAIWNVLHDGPIVRITGTMPGDVQFAVAIGYLRKRFPDPGDCIFLTLHDCTAISYQLWDSDSVVTDLASIAAAEPEILSADEPATVYCVTALCASTLPASRSLSTADEPSFSTNCVA